ncbi:hypothetical protein [Nostoc sp. 'Peltigera malacea cyanobiont' DB3992]|uniref:hypothetical protein n=1 Tax=Nostoc sp. 'Peltigera malacea cyanobiont' DB3992 TaxID=1206980 RepID=UPI0026D88970|nr:hypothetical protein [Nostoc sp. 'Peltigera malacea cyanobiont' DB3992]
MKQKLTSTHTFEFIDEILAQQSVNLFSLNPQKTLMTSFAELGNLIAEQNTDIQIITTIQQTLESIVRTQLENFPENIFWDFDFLVSSMLRQALTAEEGAINFLKIFSKKMICLTEMFGNKTEMRFRYVHDFMYGFDWARWVQKEPQNRAHVEPFSLVFLIICSLKVKNFYNVLIMVRLYLINCVKLATATPSLFLVNQKMNTVC